MSSCELQSFFKHGHISCKMCLALGPARLHHAWTQKNPTIIHTNISTLWQNRVVGYVLKLKFRYSEKRSEFSRFIAILAAFFRRVVFLVPPANPRQTTIITFVSGNGQTRGTIPPPNLQIWVLALTCISAKGRRMNWLQSTKQFWSIHTLFEGQNEP